MKKTPLYLLTVALLAAACTPKIQERFLQMEDIEQVPVAIENTKAMQIGGPCQDIEGYIPDTNYLEHTPIKYIRVNVHWFNIADSSKNMVGQSAIDFAKSLIQTANQDLERNQPMWLPHGNQTPTLPIRHRYVLSPRPNDPTDTGIYFHFVDDESCYLVHKGKNANLYKRDLIRKYAIQLDTVLNIFILPHHPDSVASPTYAPNSTGVALGTVVKVAGMIENGQPSWHYRSLINHEIGHSFGLSHTWAYNDGCDDTPQHKQDCWSRNERPECKETTSNNVMDYNAEQNAWTPCQIGKVLKRMADPRSTLRGVLEERWCTLNPNAHIYIKDTIVWAGAKDLEGHLTIEPGGELTVRCRLSLPKGAKITIKAGGRLILEDAQLHNACGDLWEGIQIEQIGKAKGEVFFVGMPSIENTINKVE
ncbi:MAG: M43 family zinc metalloprotease [Saprospiraceae bacterium]